MDGERFGEQISLPSNVKHRWPSADIDNRGNVFSSMYSVSRGPDDLTHVRPHGIEAGTGKRTAVACARTRGFSLIEPVPR